MIESFNPWTELCNYTYNNAMLQQPHNSVVQDKTNSDLFSQMVWIVGEATVVAVAHYHMTLLTCLSFLRLHCIPLIVLGPVGRTRHDLLMAMAELQECQANYTRIVLATAWNLFVNVILSQIIHLAEPQLEGGAVRSTFGEGTAKGFAITAGEYWA